jgi:TolA-binding protein
VFGLLLLLALLSSSCAYYNTFYLARKYYTTATAGLPYPVEKPTGTQTGNYQKSIDYAKKVIANYPKSKWVDDAYLMWARALLGKDDPLQTVNMLQDFPSRYPDSPLRDEATFYLGVAHRQARKFHESLVPLDEYLEKAPEGELAPYAHLERSRALMSLGRPIEAAQAASQVVDRFPEHPLVVRARAARAEARLAGDDPAGAREDFQALGSRALDDNERFTFLLREADCLETARDYDAGLELLSSALAHEPSPVKTASGAAPTGPGADRYGQLTLRIGTMHLLAGRSEQALAAYRNVLQDYPKTPLAAEAQYRIGYTHETVLDDFDGARQEYAKVRDHSTGSAFFAQATQRQQSLDRLARFRSGGADSVDRKLEAGFLLAEQYLFQLDKPERALEAYAELAREHSGTAAGAKAMTAQAWVLRRKLDRPEAADSLLWKVVREYPATEAQLAARDYLEASGQPVPGELIRLPEVVEPPPDTTLRLTPPPPGPSPLGTPQGPPMPGAPSPGDTLGPDTRDPRVGRFPSVADTAGGGVRPKLPTDPALVRPSAPVLPGRVAPPVSAPAFERADSLLRAAADRAFRAPSDTTRRLPFAVPRPPRADSLRMAPAPIPRPAPADSVRRAPSDSTRRAPPDTTRRAPPRPARPWVPTDTLRWAPR